MQCKCIYSVCVRQADDGCAKGKSQNSASVSRTEKGIAMNQEWMTYSS